MKTAAFLRFFPLAFVLVGVGSWAISGNARPAVPDVAPDSIGQDAISAAGAIPPYGVISHGTASSSEAIAPYGNFNRDTTATPDTVLPYGAMSHDALTASVTVLPYGAMSGQSVR